MLAKRQIKQFKGDKCDLSSFGFSAGIWLALNFDESDLFTDSIQLQRILFSKSKNLLGQEFDFILYDARQALNLDALAIAVGCLKAGGVLLLWLPQSLNQRIDQDSTRWSGDENGIITENFNQHFESLIQNLPAFQACPNAYQKLSVNHLQATSEQQILLQQILAQKADLFVLTAKRGRGKSALAGLLIQSLHQQNTAQRILVTSPNKSAVENLKIFAQEKIEFIAPDELYQQVQDNPIQFAGDWLVVDEAAMIPLDLLFQFTTTFKHILFSTTIHSYEGTGRGFLLKFLPKLNRTFQHFELFNPLRWREDDPLEAFIEQLLLLDAEAHLISPKLALKSAVEIQKISQTDLIKQKEAFYGLLMLAHYRTSPLDLRRLLDAPQQQFWIASQQQQLLAGVWAVEEGGLTDDELIQKICLGERRPKGNLVAQSLAFNGNLAQACKLTSLRISRIAVHPNCQHQGIGQTLVNHILKSINVDFVSVSFGYTKELMGFWKKLGFELVHISDKKEASSGCYSAIAIHALSCQGKYLLEQALNHFQRNFPFTAHPLIDQISINIDNQLSQEDLAILRNFAFSHRTLFNSSGAIQRLLAQDKQKKSAYLWEYFSGNNCSSAIECSSKKALKKCRAEVSTLLQNYFEKSIH
ncbi:tRNA(Met) cytidine acetyltransferase TmcA [Pasteurella bettyae]|uniref:tRNA(Met) cytidine acetyltransferase TmcA n=1 Tax=Pasteurella bettyae TaxID=752 RepID=UPI003D28017F